MKIWLDDLRQPLPEYVWVKSVGEAKRVIKECRLGGIPIEEVSLDYELGEYELDGGKGLRLLEWLADQELFLPCDVHSTHIYGRPLMQKFIEDNWPQKAGM